MGVGVKVRGLRPGGRAFQRKANGGRGGRGRRQGEGLLLSADARVRDSFR